MGSDISDAVDLKTLNIDPGVGAYSHYVTNLPRWRYAIRQRLIEIVRAETPMLARLQRSSRTAFLDSYFAITANLGTHTFYMIMLPIIFWCGYPEVGRAMVHLLAAGVCLSGLLKDLLCLPRPASPPLERITMSEHVSLEYGFPSTHATNAVSVAIYAMHQLRLSQLPNAYLRLAIEASCYWYVVTIAFGRLYCGMHGFLDVAVGSALGLLLAVCQCYYGPAFDQWIYHGSLLNPSLVLIAMLLFIKIHPEPVDDCPCFDDSVAFAAVVAGVEVGSWQTEQHSLPGISNFRFFDFDRHPVIQFGFRIAIGVLILFIWRGTMKPQLLKHLPPIFRVVENLGLSLPRRYFMRASIYKNVPRELKDDDVIPTAAEIPSMIASLRHPRRRAISIGPQSIADVYETMDLVKKRRDSNEQMGAPGYIKPSKANDSATHSGPRNARNSTGDLEESESGQLQRLISQVKQPRVRYDVEVVTKLIIYSGIGWIAVWVNPYVFFRILGLGI